VCVNNCVSVFEYRKPTRRVELLSLENMAKMTSTVGTGDFNPESQSVATHSEEQQSTHLDMPQDLSSCLYVCQIVVDNDPGTTHWTIAPGIPSKNAGHPHPLENLVVDL
jgi:hypothetical protein